jgi:hypothetical protein
MILDRQRLADYVGSDASFEAQFLTLLAETVSACIDALNPPSAETYRVLHSAKPGLVVSTTETFAVQLGQVCDVLVDVAQWPLPHAQAKSLVDLRVQLEQLGFEIRQALAA